MGLRLGDGTLVDERPYGDTLRGPRALLERGDRLSEPGREGVIHARLPVRLRVRVRVRDRDRVRVKVIARCRTRPPAS